MHPLPPPDPSVSTPVRGARAYAVALACAAAACVLRVALAPWLQGEAPFILSVPAVLVAAWYGGTGPGLLTTALGAALGAWVLAHGDPTLVLPPGGGLAIAIYVGVSGLVLAVALLQRTAQARARSEAAARLAGERRWEVTLRSIGDAVIAVDTEGRVTFANPEAERLTGWPQSEAAGRSCHEVFQVVDEQTREDLGCPAERALREDLSSAPSNHRILVARDGAERPVDVGGAPIRGSDGRVVGAVLTFRDVTLRVESERALRESQQDLSHAQAVAQTGSWRLDVRHNDLRWSEQTYRMFGVPIGTALTYEAFLATVHPDDRARVDEAWQAALRGAPYDIEHRVVVADQVRWVHERAELEFDRNGALLVGFGAVQDITERKQALHDLQRERDFVAAVLDTVGAVVVVLDRQGTVVRMNQAAAEQGGYTLDEVSGRPVWDAFVPPEEREDVRAAVADLFAGRFPNRLESHLLTKDGGSRLFAWSNTALLDAQGAVEHVIATGIDITGARAAEDQMRWWNEELDQIVSERTAELRAAVALRDELLAREKEAQERLRTVHAALEESEANYRLLFEASPQPIGLVDAETSRFVAANEAALNAYGYEREEFLRLRPRDLRADGSDGMLGGASGDPPWYTQLSATALHRRKDGSLIEMEVTARALRFGGRPAWLVVATDVTEKRQAAERLQRSFEQVRRLAQRLQVVREEERAYVAREVHDELGQSLTGLKMDIAWLQARLARGPDAASADAVVSRLGAMSDLVDVTVQAVRRIATELRPPVLDSLGLVAAIEWQARDFERRTQIVCEFATNAEDLPVGAECSTAVFRILQEALTNVARHARATHVQVRLDVAQSRLSLEVVDNGIGIGEHATRVGDSLGLLGMRERALQFGGEVSIGDAPGGGTRVTAALPYPCLGADRPDAVSARS